MLYALRDPLSFVLLVASFVVASTLAGWLSVLAVGRAGSAVLDDPGRRRPDPRRHLEPFGVVAAALTGVGWFRPAPVPHTQQRLLAATLTGPAVLLGTGAVLLLAFGALQGGVAGADTTVLQRGAGGLDLLPRALLLAGLVHLYVGLLSLVPLPPLEGGRLLFAKAPRTRGWQQADLYLGEKNLGTVAVLVLLLLPLGGQLPLLLSLLSLVGEPAVRLLTGAL